ncbi:helix-turn-helix transcriptional regulator [Streptomyces sp. NPDC026665]|uniref:helix-turn-helix domain-containing protein n=1 Tax=Streptomyces sp. NPDC026665 TaxID=3154798 RepID=UPI0033D7ACCD
MRELPEDDDWLRSRQRQIGDRVEATRKHQNLTQEALHLAAGIDRRTLQAVEAGTANPTLATLLRIAHALDVSLAQLVDYGALTAEPASTPPSTPAAEPRPADTPDQG